MRAPTRTARASGGLVLLGAFSVTACYKATFVDDPSALEREPTHEVWNDHFFWGLTGEHSHTARSCAPMG